MSMLFTWNFRNKFLTKRINLVATFIQLITPCMNKYLPFLLILMCAFSMQAQIILSEKFDGDVLPDGWTQETLATDGGWLLGEAHDLGSAIFPVIEHGNFIGTNDICFCDKSNDFLISPSVDLSSYSELWLLFDYSFLDFAPQQFSLEISTDGGDNWDVIENLSFSAAGYYGWWETKYFDISDYVGYSDVKIGFRYNDGGDWWSYGAALDNVKLFQSLPNDISLDSIYVSGEYSLIGSEVIISGVVTNFGLNNLTSFTVNWDDGTSSSSAEITGIDILRFESYHFTHPINYIPDAAIKYDIEVSAINPNGGIDGDLYDNYLQQNVFGCSSVPDKKVVAELATGTWCAWCVRGHVYMDSMYLLYPQDFIGIAVHNFDPMEVEDYNDALYAYQNYLSYSGGAAYPSIIAEHKFYMDPMEMPEKMPAYMNKTVPVDLFLYGNYNDSTDLIQVNLKAKFVTQMNGIDYRFNLVIKEDSVTGVGSAWNQSNAYSGGGYGDMGGFELLPDPVPAVDMVYDHVARYLADGWYGAEGSIASDVNDLDTFNIHYDLSMDEIWNIDHIKLVGMVIDNASGKIINAREVRLTDLSTQPEDTVIVIDTTIVQGLYGIIPSTIKVFPNPANDFSMIDFTLSQASDVQIIISDITGKIVGSKHYGKLNGAQQLYINTKLLQNGIYIISLQINDEIFKQQIIVSH